MWLRYGYNESISPNVFWQSGLVAFNKTATFANQEFEIDIKVLYFLFQNWWLATQECLCSLHQHVSVDYKVRLPSTTTDFFENQIDVH